MGGSQAVAALIGQFASPDFGLWRPVHHAVHSGARHRARLSCVHRLRSDWLEAVRLFLLAFFVMTQLPQSFTCHIARFAHWRSVSALYLGFRPGTSLA